MRAVPDCIYNVSAEGRPILLGAQRAEGQSDVARGRMTSRVPVICHDTEKVTHMHVFRKKKKLDGSVPLRPSEAGHSRGD